MVDNFRLSERRIHANTHQSTPKQAQSRGSKKSVRWGAYPHCEGKCVLGQGRCVRVTCFVTASTSPLHRPLALFLVCGCVRASAPSRVCGDARTTFMCGRGCVHIHNVRSPLPVACLCTHPFVVCLSHARTCACVHRRDGQVSCGLSSWPGSHLNGDVRVCVRFVCPHRD